MHFSTFTCNTCSEQISLGKIASHIPQCLRKFCIEKMEMLPNCTCNSCKGLKIHTGDSYLTIANANASSLSTQPQSVQSAPSVPIHSIESSRSSSHNSSNSKILLSKKQEEAEICVICSGKRSNGQLNVPIIYIGKFRKFKVCKKDHIASIADLSKLLEAIKQEWTIILENGDRALNPLRTSNNSIEEQQEEVNCNGFVDEECKNSCINTSPPLLYIYEHTNTNKGTKYFCEPKHLLRYITEYYLKRGTKTWECYEAEQKKSKATSSQGSKKRKSSDQAETTVQSILN